MNKHVCETPVPAEPIRFVALKVERNPIFDDIIEQVMLSGMTPEQFGEELRKHYQSNGMCPQDPVPYKSDPPTRGYRPNDPMFPSPEQMAVDLKPLTDKIKENRLERASKTFQLVDDLRRIDPPSKYFRPKYMKDVAYNALVAGDLVFMSWKHGNRAVGVFDGDSIYYVNKDDTVYSVEIQEHTVINEEITLWRI